MFKAAARTNQGHLIILGLSHENLRRLKQGEPIRIDMEDLGIKGSTCFIFSGKDEKAMAKEMSEFIGPDTKIRELPVSWPFG